MRYKMIVFDIDGTITRHVSSWRYLHEELKLWDVLAKKYQDLFLAGKISYRKFCELDAAHWKGLDAERLYRLFKKIKFTKNAKRVIKRLKKEGFILIAVSTGLQFITDRIKEELKFDKVIGNRLTVYKGKTTGGVKITLSHGEKGKVLKRLIKEYNLSPKEVIAIGDSEGDLPMMKIAGYSIAFNSTSDVLSTMVDYECRSLDFEEIGDKIKEITCGGDEKRKKK